VAQGTVEVFDSFIQYSFEGNAENPFDLGATPDVLKCAIVDDTITPATDDADPCWGTGGTVNFEPGKMEGGSYTAGGLVLSSVAVTNAAGVIHLDFDDPATWAVNGSNPTTCYYGIIYSDTATNKNAIGYVDLGGVFNATTGDLTITWGAPFMTADQT
jgi:hypothetical protein